MHCALRTKCALGNPARIGGPGPRDSALIAAVWRVKKVRVPSGWSASGTNEADALARNDRFQHSLNLTQHLDARGYAFRSENRRSGFIPLFALACRPQCIFEDPRPILT